MSAPNSPHINQNLQNRFLKAINLVVLSSKENANRAAFERKETLCTEFDRLCTLTRFGDQSALKSELSQTLEEIVNLVTPYTTDVQLEKIVELHQECVTALSEKKATTKTRVKLPKSFTSDIYLN